MQLEVFKYEEDNHFSEVRTVEIDGEIWFHASDVAAVLGYSNGSKAIREHCRETGIRKWESVSGTRATSHLLINEPNIYRLIIKSKLPSAEKFEDWLFEEVVPSIRNKGYYGKIDRGQVSNFVTRYSENMHKIGHDYFSVISELYLTLYKEFEKHGYEIPDKGEHGALMYPDISVGRRFASYLKSIKSEFYDQVLKYDHSFGPKDTRNPVKANKYPIEALPTFRRYVHEKWIPEFADEYFRKRDPKALEYLPLLLPEAPKKESQFNKNLVKGLNFKNSK